MSSKIGGVPGGQHIHHQAPVQGPQQTAPIQPGLPQPNANQQGTQQNFDRMTGVGMRIQTGVIPGAQGARAALGVTNNPAAVMQQLMNQAQAGQQMQAMGQFGMQAMQAMGLGHMPQAQQFAMMSSLGNNMIQHSMSMAPSVFAQSVSQVMGAPFTNAIGNHVLAHGFGQARIEQMGPQFLSTLSQPAPSSWARNTLGTLGPQYFNQFDPRTLAAMPDRALMPFGNQLMNAIQSTAPFQLGQQMMQGIGPNIISQLGQKFLGQLPAGAQSVLGSGMQSLLQGNPMQAGEALLKGIGLPSLKDIGANILGKIPGLDKLAGSELAQTVLGGIKNGNLGQTLLNGAGQFLKDKLLGPNGKLMDIGKSLVGKLGDGFLGKTAGSILDMVGSGKGLGEIGKGLLDKFGGKVLDKLGGAGKIASGVLGLLNGEFTPEKALKLAINFIPGVGPIVGALSAIPGIGPIVDKVLGGVGKLIGKIPGVSAVFKGVNKLVGGIKKIGGKVVDGIKNVGKKVLGGVGKALSKI
jgi:hypothetical protein